jgi:hypothetical protein
MSVAPGAPADATTLAADGPSGVEAQIQALEGEIASSASQVHQLTVAYDQDLLQATGLAEQVAADNAHLGQLEHQVGSSLAVLRQEAVMSYTGAADSSTAPVATTAAGSAVSQEYLRVTVGNVADSLDQLNLEQQQVADAEATVRREQAARQEALSSAGAARDRALSQAAQEQTRLNQEEQRLAQLQAAAQAQARSAAVHAAATTQGLPVGGGVVAAVSAAVGGPGAGPTQAPAPAAPARTAPPVAAAPGTTAPAVTAPPTTAPPTTAPPTTAPPTTAPPAPAPGGAQPGVWLQLRECESGDNYQANTGNGFYGAYQFSESTWTGLGYPGRPDTEPAAMQDQAAMRLQAQRGWGQWPACAALLGLS